MHCSHVRMVCALLAHSHMLVCTRVMWALLYITATAFVLSAAAWYSCSKSWWIIQCHENLWEAFIAFTRCACKADSLTRHAPSCYCVAVRDTCFAYVLLSTLPLLHLTASFSTSLGKYYSTWVSYWYLMELPYWYLTDHRPQGLGILIALVCIAVICRTVVPMYTFMVLLRYSTLVLV